MADREFDLALHNVAALLNLASALAIDNLNRRADWDGAEVYHLHVSTGDQLVALLIAARDYADRVLASDNGSAT